ncbi:MAG: hypothetical protein WKF66_10260 [Pedobacter sp.]
MTNLTIPMTKYNALNTLSGTFLILNNVLRLLFSIPVAFALVMHAETIELTALVQLKGFMPAMIATSLASFIVLQYVHIQNKTLNKAYPWEKSYKERLTKQFSQCILAPIVIAFLSATIYYGRYRIVISDTAWFTHYFMPIALLIFVLNLLYVAKDAFFLIIKPQPDFASELRIDKNADEVKTIVKYVKLPLTSKIKNFREICFIKSFQGTRIAYTKSGDQFEWPHPICDSLSHLEVGKYLEINRREIIEKNNIDDITENKRIFLLTLRHPAGIVVRVSQRHSDDYRLIFQHLKKKIEIANSKKTATK